MATESKIKCGYVDDPPQMLSVSGYFGVIPKEYDDENRIRSAEDVVTYLRVRPGQLVANTMWLNYRGLGVADHEGIVSPAYRAYDLGSDLHARFVHHLLRSDPYVGEYTRLAYGIRPNSLQVSREDFAALPVVVPPLATQTAIADFLDRKTAAIDALIEKKQKLLDLLAEKRAALINQAVTKGLDPNVPMKDSGIPWIGEIPAHWEVQRLKFMVTEVVDCHHSTPSYEDDGPFPALRTADVQPGFLDLQRARRVNEDEYLHRISRLRPLAGDVIYSREGERYGKAAPVPEGADVCLAQRVMLFRAAREHDGTFFMWALNADCVYQQMKQYVVGATSPHVNIGDIREAWIPAPPYGEQQGIGQFVSEAVEKQRAVGDILEQHITLLQEYRQALITAAVTGQLDVGDAAA